MRAIRSKIMLGLTLFCFGCGQVTVGGYDTSYSPPKYAPSGNSEMVRQGVGFSGNSSTTTTSTSSQTSTDGISNEAATILAVLGLVALIALADSKAACSGSGCGASGGGTLAVGL